MMMMIKIGLKSNDGSNGEEESDLTMNLDSATKGLIYDPGNDDDDE